MDIQNQFEEKSMIKDNGLTFSFGENWKNYLIKITKNKIRIARDSIAEFLGDISNKTCLDIGSGSGIFSYSMFILGAKKLVSFDIDPYSVQCMEYLRSSVKSPKKWHVYHGSILDKKFISSLGKFDVVYSWGVLHHTGKM